MNFLNFKKKIEISFYSIIIFFTFYTYTFYSIISKNYNLLFTLITIFLYIIFYKIYLKSDLKFTIIISYWEILTLFLLLIFGFILNYQDFFYSLHGDEFANALRTQRTSIFTSFLFLNKINIGFLNNINFNNVVYLVSFLQLIFLFFIIYLIGNKKNIYTIALLILITFPFRYFLKDFGMHPPINHLFSLFITSFLGFKDYWFRFSYVIFYVFGNLVLLYQLNKIFSDNKKNLIIIIFTFTIPICLLSSSNIDHSVWGNIFLLNFLFYFYFNDKLDYKKIVLLISIFSMARITNFILILPVLYNYLIEKRGKLDLKESILTFLPILFFLPFILKLYLLGSNVHSVGLDNIHNEIIQSLKSNAYFISTFIFVPKYIIFFSFIGFLIFTFKKKICNKNYTLITTFVLYLLVYSSIAEKFIGHPKYIFEFVMPFLILFLIVLIDKVKKFTSFALIVLSLLNVYNLKKYNQIIHYSEQNDQKFQIRARYDYKSAFDSLKKDNLKLSNYFIGVYYGFVTEILNDYKFNELLVVRKRILNTKNNLSKGKNLITILNENQNINSLLIIEDSYKYNKELFKKWKVQNKFYYNDYMHNKIIHLVK